MSASLAALLASPLAKRYRLDVVATYGGPDPAKRLAVYCVALLRLAGWRLRRRGSVVHIHATVRGSAYRKAVCVLFAKALRCRVVLQVHSGPGDIAEFRGRLGRIRLGLLGAAFAAADVVLTVSAASAAALSEAGVGAEVGVVPNPAPPAPSFERKEPDDGTVSVAYLGGFANPAKGGDVLLEALDQAVAGQPRLQVTLAGPGQLPAEGKVLCERATTIEWAGWLDDAAKDVLLREASVFIMPSRSEGLPMALLEAMAYGMAVVATRVGGIPEVVEDGVEGLLVEPGDPAALSAALRRLGADAKLRGRLAAAARARAERLDAVEVAGRLEAIYARLD